MKDIAKIYFIGIGGIGMSAIARYMQAQGVAVYGYDKTSTVLTRKLEDEGMTIHYNDDPEWIPSGIDLVVYTPAIPDENKELNWFRDQGYEVIKRAEMLGRLSHDCKTIAVAGTHGKTSTSSTIAHLLTYGEQSISAFIGGIMVNYESNYIAGTSDWIVVEADEYDRSFLWLQPNVAVVMSMDPDHLDIYGAHDSMIDSFNAFVRKVASGGRLVIKQDLVEKLTKETFDYLDEEGIELVTFGYNGAMANIQNVRVAEGRFQFDLELQDRCICDIWSSMPGYHNIENTVAAILAIEGFDLDEEVLRNGLLDFKGIKRRFERVVEEEVVYIDDYAHHPTELGYAIQAAKMLYPDKEILGIFQPHLYSRTRDFAEGFARELDQLDEIVLMDIYPARELPIEGVSSEMILNRMHNEKKTIASKEELMDVLNKKQYEVIMTLGAGDIDVFVPQIKKMIEERIG